MIAVAKNSFLNDLVLTFVVVSIFAILIVPLPPLMLDGLIILNLMIAVIILMVSLYLTRPLEFASYPTLLLIITVFRLAINVATSRSILLHAEAGKVVETFAMFVVGGNYVVGIIIFIILIIIQFLVVTEGAKRVAEVAARFTLDA
ncbi:MAG TPA: EscV/YscV/HrcV family type III secretion system export apparatus protein, partial [Cyanobacteria bacterium UBA8530]|nr:EscV/YscV/HrcV family type III secretion system export apparatus protein [Cyanobacteria bacterium UBA8530]